MPIRVRFRFNKRTGEVEEFLVDDMDQTLSEADHDRAARAVAQMVAVNPAIVPMDNHELAALAAAATVADDEETGAAGADEQRSADEGRERQSADLDEERIRDR